MKYLLYADLKKKQWLYFFIALFIICKISLSFEYQMYCMFALLLYLFSFLKDDQRIWLPFLTYPLPIYKIVISKALVLLITIVIVIVSLYITLPFTSFTIACTYIILHSLCFLLFTYFVCDGYCGAQQINILELLSAVFFFCSLYYSESWFMIFHHLFPYVGMIVLLVISIVVVCSPQRIQKKKTNQIALASLMSGIKMMHEITMMDAPAFLRRKPRFFISSFTFKNDSVDTFVIVLRFVLMQIQVPLGIFVFSILLAMPLLIQGVGLILIYVSIKNIHTMYASLHKIGIKK